ncbi:MAG: sigma-54-dependent Fis family transcriptional regulator [Paucibacter sp.]|nr:sigma-54-dependent Fis family transcriptional regulator [Roseateles sp.]
MGNLHIGGEQHGLRLSAARQRFFDLGEAPIDLLDPVVIRSWERCRRFGLNCDDSSHHLASLDRTALRVEQERNRHLLQQSRPIMAHVYQQIRESGSMVVLADAHGLLLESMGDADFVARADRVALTAGACWDENQRGTNAIGTALAEEATVEVLGAEHFLLDNAFLTCCASPIFGPDGHIVGALDISGDHRGHQHHTLGLIRLSTSIVEKRLFETLHAQDVLICFHHRADFLGSPTEGMAAVSLDGMIQAINATGLEILKLRRVDVVRREFSMVFERPLPYVIDRLRNNLQGHLSLNGNGRPLSVQMRGQLPPLNVVTHRIGEAGASAAPSARPARRPDATKPGAPTLATLDTGDAALQAAIDRAQRILGRDIPLLIQGESGAGKEVFAKAFHHSGPRRDGPFVALNCASIPDSLIESELFGYQGGAFTGARKEGSPGKILQAHGGTLFLDEIGDMPLALQARLLRVLQERDLTPLGSTRPVRVDFSLVCATHRRLRDEVAAGRFREDLYYRLNGLSVNLPALRDRSDIRQLAYKLAAAESGTGAPVVFSECALLAFEQYRWPGNIRELQNVVRVAIALMDPNSPALTKSYLPDELLESLNSSAAAAGKLAGRPLPAAGGNLQEINRQLAVQALDAVAGNISAAARQLGISRNTLYRMLRRR